MTATIIPFPKKPTKEERERAARIDWYAEILKQPDNAGLIDAMNDGTIISTDELVKAREEHKAGKRP